MEKQINKSQSYVPIMTSQSQPVQTIDTNQIPRNSFGTDSLQQKPQKQTLFQPDTSEIPGLPKNLKEARDKLMNKTSTLKDRLSTSYQLLKENKIIVKDGKETKFELSQEKFKLDIINNINPMLLKILSRFLYDIYQEHIEPYIEREETFGYQNIFGNLPNQIQQECIVNLQYLVVTVYCRLIHENKFYPQSEEVPKNSKEASAITRTSSEASNDQIKLAAFILIKMMFNSELKKEIVVSVLNYTENNGEDLLKKVKKENQKFVESIFDDALQLNRDKVQMIDTLVQCYLAISASCLDLLDNDLILQSVCKIVINCYRLQEYFSSVFNKKLYDVSNPEFLFGFTFRDRLLDQNTSTYYTRTTLLNLNLQITKVLSSKWKSRYNRGLMTENLLKTQDQLDQQIMQGLDLIIIRQIRAYQLTERFVKVLQNQPLSKTSKNQQFESIKEVEESFISDDSNHAQEETKSSPLSQPVYQELTKGELSIYNSGKLILDPSINLKSNDRNQPVSLLEDIHEQLNWIRVNIAVVEVSNELMPNYFHRKESELTSDQKMSSPKSLISHLCDLVRVQLCFIVRFQFQKGFNRRFQHPIIEIPDFLDHDCFLIQTLIRLFFFGDYQGQNHDFRAVMVKQIYLTLDMIAEGHFDSADRQHYLKLMFLLFMNNKLEPLSEPIAVFGNEINRAYSFITSINKLIKIEFYSEKYVRLFEETFDMNNIQDILQLQEIVKEIEQKRGDELAQNQNSQEESIILINKVLIQTQAINQLVQTAIKSDLICGIALDQLIGEIQTNGMKNCDPQGAIYVERSQHVTLANGQSQISTLEYKLAQSGPFSSQIYIYFKLALGLLNPQTTTHAKVYDILNHSDAHFEKWHQVQSYTMSKNSFGLRGSSQSHPSFQPHQVQSGFNQCDDCLRLNFERFQLNSQIKPSQLISLFTILLRRIQELSKSLDDQEQAQNSQLGQGQLKQMTNMSAEQIRSHLSKIKLGQNQNKVITKKTLIANQSSGFKIVEKVNAIMTRFMIYCSQNSELVNSLVASVTNIERSEVAKFPSQLDAQKLKSFQMTQFQPVNLRDIPNIEFKSILLRNIAFLIDSKDPKRYDTVTYMLDLMRDNLKQIKSEHTKYREYSVDFKRLMNQLDPSHKQRQSQEGGYLRGGRERSASNIFFAEYDSHLQKQRLFFRKLAEVQITSLSLYTKIVRKDDWCLEIFERKVFLEQVLMHLQRYVVQEGSYISELIQEGLAIFLFQRREPCDPFNLKQQTSFHENPLVQQTAVNSLVTVYERMFEFVLTTILDYIQVVFNDDSEVQSPSIDAQTNVLQSIKMVLETLNNKVIVKEGNTVRDSITSDLIKLQRAIRPTEIQLIKKIFIFLREQQATQQVDIQYIIKQMTTLLIRLFGVIPKAIHLREFFSFLREIFYHNQLMDEVDVNLAEDVLKILNYSINFRNKAQIVSGPGQRNEMIDHFVFSKIAPGILILNDFDLSREPQLCLLFRISHDQIAQETSQIKHKQLKSVLFSIQQRQTENGNFMIDRINFDLEIIVDIEKGTFTLQDPINITPNTSIQNQPNVQQFKPRVLENRWHLLILKFKHKSGGFLSNNDTYSLEVYLDKLDNSSRVIYQLPRFDPRQKYLVSLGNTVEFCTQNGETRVQNMYFRGRCSLPLFFTGLPDIKSLEQSAETWRAIRESLTEFLNTKELISKKQLDLNPWIQKYMPDGAQFKQNKKYIITEFQTLDNFTQQVVALHQALNKQGYLCAAHCRRASEVFVGLGGFKNMYPLIDRVVKSNLIEIGRGKPAQIICQAFKVLGSLLDQEPAHIEMHLKKKNLINTLRYCILRLGKYQMITQELLLDIKNIVKKNILSQVTFSSQNERQYLIQNASAEIKNHKQFYAEFLSEYTHQIVLDKKIAMLTCQIVSKAHPDISSTTHSSISGGSKQTVVFTELLDLIHNICVPEPLQNQGVNTKFYKNARSNSKSSDNDKNQESASSQMENSAIVGSLHSVQLFCDGEVLQQNIVTHRTVEQLIEIATSSDILQQLLYNQIHQLGECLSSSILYLDDQKSFSQILSKVIQENIGISKIQLLIYLQVVLQVIRYDELKNKPQLYAVYTDKSQFKVESLAAILYQFDSNPREKITEDLKILNDKLISMTLLILIKDFLVSKKLQQRQNKAQTDKVALFDQEKKLLLNHIKKYLLSNSQILTETYLTLMQISFNKRNCVDRPPMLDEIDSAIKESRLKMENKTYYDVIEFDIDFYFMVLDCFEKLTQQTKVVFLNQVMLFQKNHEEGFMKLLLGQVSSDDQNPFLKKLATFYYQVVQLCLESKEEVLYQSCIRVLVEICVNHFTHSLDDLNQYQLSENDEKSLYLFRRIIAYFGNELKMQLQILNKIIKQILIEINWRKNPYSQTEQVKLNLKIIQMLQFIEELYIKNKAELADMPIFYSILVLLMFLFEQLGLLSMDVPDRITGEGFQETQQQRQNKQQKQNQVKPIQSQGKLDQSNIQPKILVNVDKQPVQLYASADETVSQFSLPQVPIVRSPTQANSRRQLAPQKQEFQVISSLPQFQTRTENFISGGPVRIFLHILVSCLYDMRTPVDSFQLVLDLLRFLTLREKSQLVVQQIKSGLSDEFDVNSILVYNLFNRGQLNFDQLKAQQQNTISQTEKTQQVEESKSTPQQVKQLISRGYILSSDQTQEVKSFQQYEIEIYRLTLEGIINTTQQHHTNESLADNRKEQNKLPSYSDLQIAESSRNQLRKQKRWGYSMIDGFTFLQLISESIQIIGRILQEESSAEKSNDTADFNLKTNNQRAFVENDSEQLQFSSQLQDDDYMSMDYRPTPQQIKAKLQSQSKLAKILPLCAFLYDCMNEQINGGRKNIDIEIIKKINYQQYQNSVEDRLINRITRFLDETSFYHSTETLQRINLLSTFLEQGGNSDLSLFYMDGTIESATESSRMPSENFVRSDSASVKQNQQRAVVVLNTMGMVDMNILNKQISISQSMKKDQDQRIFSDQDFDASQNLIEFEPANEEEAKLIEGGIRLSAVQQQYFGVTDSSILTKSQDFKTSKIIQPDLVKMKSEQSISSNQLEIMTQDFEQSENLNNADFTDQESISVTQNDDDSRQSWVQSVKNVAKEVSPVRNQKYENHKEEQTKIRNDFKNQIFDFIRQLYLALIELNQDQNDVLKIDHLEKIISQTLFNEKQRKISISFGAATSHRFTPELNQAKFKSNEIFRIIQAEIQKTVNELKAEKQEHEKRRNAQLMGASVLQQNPLMQSQHFRPGHQFGDLNDQHSFTPQKKGEIYGNQTVSSSQGFQSGSMKHIAQGKLNIHPLSTTIAVSMNMQLDISIDSPLDEKSKLNYIYTRNLFRKIVKRLQEDESSIWFDKVEEQLAEFKEIKEQYEQMQARLEPNQLTAEAVWRQKKEGIDLKGKPPEMVKFLDQWLKNIENQSLIQNPAGRNYFVAQRRNIDSWGRMMLLKPNRKALEYQAWKFYDYFVHDFLNKAFAVSLLNDEDFPDLIKPSQIQKTIQKVTPSQDVKRQVRKRKRGEDSFEANPQSVANGTENQSDDSDYQGDQPSVENSFDSQDPNQSKDEQNLAYQESVDSVVAYSQELQRVRVDIMQRMERNKLLQRVLSDQQPLKRKLTDDPLLVEKTEQKIERIIKNEYDNRIIHTSNTKYHFDAQVIKIKGNIWGKVIITCEYFVFISYCRGIPDEKVKQLKYIDKRNNLPVKQEIILKWENIEEIMRRKVINVFQGIDITTHDKKQYTFNLTTLQNCEDFFKNVKSLIKERAKDGEELSLKLIEDPINHFKNVEQFQNEWKNGQRTNMEFLLLINKYSSRSFNDLSQYPIFPWVLNDYDSNVFEFDQLMKNEECFRDFTRHTGIMSANKIEDIEEKYAEMEIIDKQTGQKQGPEEFERMTYGEDSFQMRMGFSTGMNTSHYLSRIEPFTTAVYFNQDQDRDRRIPISFQISWENTIKQNQSNNELIPEHFYYPEALVNLNNAHLGWQPEGNIDYQIDYMFIPQWATNHFDFIRIQRECLESRYVTENLGYWIDLVFGVHQKSETKLNKFFCLAYEEWHQKPENRVKITTDNMTSILDYYTVPSKLFDQSLISQAEVITTAAAQSMQIDTTETKSNFNPNFKLIKAFLEYKTNTTQRIIGNPRGLPPRQKLRLGQISVHNYLDQSTNIVHMLFNNEKKCLVFVRQEDYNDRNSEVGNLVVYVCQETLTKDGFKEKYFDLQMRYEWVAEELHNVFQVYFSQDSKNSNQSTMKLFACGYMDNSLRIFDLDNKAGPPKIIRDHNARISCIKFSSDFKYLYSCDEDGVILHYTKKKIVPKDQKDSFPYSLLYKLQDQMDEILAIDTNQTLDMYVTLSRDGTIAVRCQRTSKLWVHFKMFCKRQNAKREEVIITGFSKAFRRIDAIRLSLHGYIVLVGSSVAPKSNQSKYLVYNLNGDTLLAQMEEKCTIKNVFLNSTEDLMVLAQNCSLSQDMSQQGNIRVLKLYGLEKIANLTKLCYEESLKEIRNQKAMNKDGNNDNNLSVNKSPLKTPIIGAIALKKGEVSLNIFYIEPSRQTKEIICFESSKSTVWSQLEDMALAPRQRQDF